MADPGPNICLDAGPWPCAERGCPAPSISCRLLAQDGVCELRFSEVWEAPPAGLARTKIGEVCRRSCNTCDDDEARQCLIDDGCVASVSQALVGDSVMLRGEALVHVAGSSDRAALAVLDLGTPQHRWRALWALLQCESPANNSWTLVSGGPEPAKTLHLPAGRGVGWRPVGFVESRRIVLGGSEPGCAIHFVYAGIGHPAYAPRCEGTDSALAGAFSGDEEPPLLRVANGRIGWYPLPPGAGPRTFDAATIGWLQRFHRLDDRPDAGSFNGDVLEQPYGEGGVAQRQADGLTPEVPARMTECIFSRCAAAFAACAHAAACRDAHDAYYRDAGFFERHTGWRRLAAKAGGSSHDGDGDGDGKPLLRRLLECSALQCACIAHDCLPHVARFRGALSEVDVAQIVELASAMAAPTPRSFGYHPGEQLGGAPAGADDGDGGGGGGALVRRAVKALGHNVTYLHGSFGAKLPALLAKLRRLALEADRANGWRRLRENSTSSFGGGGGGGDGGGGRGGLRPRTIELLDYTAVHRSSLGWHVDSQSAVTQLVMLSRPGDDFGGGELQHVVAGEVVDAAPAFGDVLVYRSHQIHRVTPLTRGRRLALAVEWWHAPLDETSEWARHRRQGDARAGECPQ